MFDPPIPWVVALNALGMPALQLGMAWLFTRLPAAWFEASPRASKPSPEFYERVLLIKRWKDRVPDGAAWFEGGFAKKSLAGNRTGEHLRRFRNETVRGEICHWAVLAAAPLFFLWNPLWADCVMAAAFAIANIPCIAIQRYNRARLDRLLRGRARARR